MIIVSRKFAPTDLVAGHPALDLVNTVTARNTESPRDWLDSYERLLEWARLAQITDQTVLKHLGEEAARSLQRGERALARLKQFREALHTAYFALLSGNRVAQPVLDELGVIWLQAQTRLRFEHSEGHIAARVSVKRSGLDLIRDSVAGPAIELLQRLPTGRARICAGHSCGWLFIDSSKGGQRVWCEMGTCGNAAKTRRHQENMERRRRAMRQPARGAAK